MGALRFGAITVALFAAVGLSACTTTQGSVPAGSALYISALQGGIVSRTGVKLSKSETQRALEAEYRALEAAPGGQPVTWAGGAVRGQVIAAAPYQVGQQNCRQFTHKVTEGTRELQARGAACRNSDGTWTPLS